MKTRIVVLAIGFVLTSLVFLTTPLYADTQLYYTYTYFEDTGHLSQKKGYSDINCTILKTTFNYYNDVGNLMQEAILATPDASGNIYYHYVNENWGSQGYGRIDRSKRKIVDSDGSMSYIYSYFLDTNVIQYKYCYQDADFTDINVTYEYDSSGALIKQAFLDSSYILTTYWPDGKKKQDAFFGADGSWQNTIEYYDSSSPVVHYQWIIDSNPAAAGDVTRYEYDALGRLTLACYDDTSVAQYVYWSDTGDLNLHYYAYFDPDYDWQRTIEYYEDGTTMHHKWVVDANPDVDGDDIYYEYDTYGNMTYKRLDTGESYTYDNQNRIIIHTLASGDFINTTYYDSGNKQYDAFFRPGWIWQKTIEYYEDGVIMRYQWVTDANPDLAGDDVYYEYDTLGNMTYKRLDTGESYTYDNQNRIISHTLASGDFINTTYYASGNKQYDAFFQPGWSWQKTIEYYDDASSDVHYQWLADAYPEIDGDDIYYEYDMLGNMTGKKLDTGENYTYTFDYNTPASIRNSIQEYMNTAGYGGRYWVPTPQIEADNGRYYAVWAVKNSDESNSLKFQLFDKDGKVICASPIILADNTTLSDPGGSKIVILGDGNVAVFWGEVDSNYSPTVINYQIIDSSGNTLFSSPVAIASNASLNSVITFENGNIAVFWDDDSGFKVQILDSNGNLLKSPITLADQRTTNLPSMPLAYTLANGNVAVFWDAVSSTGGWLFKGQVFDQEGNAILASPVCLSDASASSAYMNNVTPLADGNVAVFWGESGPAGWIIKGRVLDKDGNALLDYPTILTGEDPLGYGWIDNVTVLSDGNIAIFWREGSAPGTYSVKARVLDESGNAINSLPITLSSDENINGIMIQSVVELENGNVAAFWEEVDSDGYHSAKVRILDNSGNPLSDSPTTLSDDNLKWRADVKSIAVLANGNIAVFMEEENHHDVYDSSHTDLLKMQIVDQDGNALFASPVSLTAETSNNAFFMNNVITLTNGNIEVFWASSDTNFSLVTQIFDHDGNALLVPPTVVAGFSAINATITLVDDNLVLFWKECDANGDACLRSQVIDLNGNLVSSDVLNSSTLASSNLVSMVVTDYWAGTGNKYRDEIYDSDMSWQKTIEYYDDASSAMHYQWLADANPDTAGDDIYYEYDTLGNIIVKSVDTGEMFAYDDQNRITIHTLVSGDIINTTYYESGNKQHDFIYDSDGNWQKTIEYYDDASSAMHYQWLADANPDVEGDDAAYEYDTQQRLIAKWLDTGEVYSYTYGYEPAYIRDSVQEYVANEGGNNSTYQVIAVNDKYYAIWTGNNGDGTLKSPVKAQIFDSDGNTLFDASATISYGKVENVTVLTNGNIAVFSVDSNAGKLYLYTQIIDLDCTPLLATPTAISISQGYVGSKNTINNITELANGNIAISWLDRNSNYTYSLKTSLLDSSGNILNATPITLTSNSWTPMISSVTTLASGDVSISWVDGSNWWKTYLKTQVFDSNGEALSDPTTIMTYNGHVESVKTLANGDTAVCWFEHGSTSSIKVEILDSSGNLKASPTVIASNSNLNTVNDVLTLTDGNIAVFWQECYSDLGDVLKFTVIDSSGKDLFAAPVTITANERLQYAWIRNVTELSNGNIAVFWDCNPSSGTVFNVQVFDQAGNSVFSPTAFSSGFQNVSVNNATALPDGGVAVYWNEADFILGDNGFYYGILNKSQAIDSAGNLVSSDTLKPSSSDLYMGEIPPIIALQNLSAAPLPEGVSISGTMVKENSYDGQNQNQGEGQN
ncbi:MAG: hypothetical protein WC738_03650 [Candidatus Omnitrophota bacterium]|jgi:hypothetical protein